MVKNKIEIPGAPETKKNSEQLEVHMNKISDVAEKVNASTDSKAKHTMKSMLKEAQDALAAILQHEQKMAATAVPKTAFKNVNIKQKKVNIINGSGISLTDQGYVVKSRGIRHE